MQGAKQCKVQNNARWKIMMNSQIRDTLLCQRLAKVKVVKWCQKKVKLTYFDVYLSETM